MPLVLLPLNLSPNDVAETCTLSRNTNLRLANLHLGNPRLRDVVLWFGAFGMKILDFLSAIFGKFVREEKGTQTQTFWSDIFRWGGGLPRERVGAKKFGTSLETQGNQTFGRDIPEFCRDIPGVPDKFEKKSLCSIIVP